MATTRIFMAAAIALCLSACGGGNSSPGSVAANGSTAVSNTGNTSSPANRSDALIRNPITPARLPDLPAEAGATNFAGRGTPDSEDFGTPDPWVSYIDGFYYMTYTHYPMVIRQSRTLAGLANAEELPVWPNEGDVEGEDYPMGAALEPWAAEFHRLRSPEDGQMHWYWYYSPGNAAAKEMHVLESEGDDVLGPYKWKSRIEPFLGKTPTDLQSSSHLDGTVFVHGDGKLYYTFSGVRGNETFTRAQSLYVAEMVNPWTITDAIPTLMSRPLYEWELRVVPTNEAPQPLQIGDKLHIIYSASACHGDDYKLGRLTVSDTADLLDPDTWGIDGITAKNPTPVFQQSMANSIYSPGHNGFFTSPDGTENWLFYHAHTEQAGTARGGGCLGQRTGHAQPFTFDADDNPVFGLPKPVTEDIAPPSGDGSWVRQFESAELFEASNRLDSLVSGQHDLVGEAGVEFGATSNSDFISYRMPLPAGTQQLQLRVRSGANRGAIGLSIELADGSVDGPTNLGSRSSYSADGGITTLNYGPLALVGGDYIVRLQADAGTEGGFSFLLDHLQAIPAALIETQ